MKVRKCVITIGGMGTRLLPITKAVSKEMLPLIDKPTIFYLVKEAYLSGIEEIIFVVSPLNINLIKNFFEINESLIAEVKDNETKLNNLNSVDDIIRKLKISYVLQKERGTYGAMYSAKEYLQDEPFVLIYGDDLLISDELPIKRLIDEYTRTNQMVVLARKVALNDLPKFGIIKYGDGNILENLVYKTEKPLPSQDVIQGHFLLTKEIFEVKDKLKYHDKELQLPKALLYCKTKTRVLLHEGIYFDIGSKLGYLKANLYFGLQSEYHDELVTFFNNIK